ncbi:hypothetical protein MJO28_012991, partial [Puccinia striiformis f. sp. tritici]
RALGYNEETAKPRSPHEYPKVGGQHISGDLMDQPPQVLVELGGEYEIFQCSEVQLDKHDGIRRGFFVGVRTLPLFIREDFLRNDGCWLVGQVNSLWEVVGSRRASCYMELTGFDFTGADGHYEMCGLKRTVYTAVVNAK